MSVSIMIHRGTHQIGGTVTEIATTRSRIFIDFGCDLSAVPDKNTDAQMVRMIRDNPCDAVLFTHYHGDHVGLMEFVPEQIPMYIGHLARKVMITIQKSLKKNPWLPETMQKAHQKMLDDILKNDHRLINYYDGQPFVVGKGQDIKVTPILADHSACDAYMFLVEAEGKRILHTGDFRTHGRMGENLFEKLKQHLQKKDIDALIIEGTMMSREEEHIMTERDMQTRAEEILDDHPYAFLLCSSTNAESLATFSLAALKSSLRMFVSPYVHQQIEIYKKHLYFKRGLQDFQFMNVRTMEPPDRFNAKLGMTQREYMRENGFLILINKYEYSRKLIRSFSDCTPEPVMIYSMWNGYIDDPHSDTYDPELAKTANMCGKYYSCHTSGHAALGDLRQLIQITAPRQAIIPIHTEHPEKFNKICGAFQNKLQYLKDGEVISLQAAKGDGSITDGRV